MQKILPFKAWQCRNCKHWHDMVTTMHGTEPLGSCHQYDYENGSQCICKKWESVDNLVYMENLYNEA